MSDSNYADAFIETIQSTLGFAPRCVRTDGKFTRFQVDNYDRKKSGWAWLKIDDDGRTFGAFGSWKTSEKHTWSDRGGNKPSPDDLVRIRSYQRAAEAEREKIYERAAIYARRIYEHAEDAAIGHKYLQAKQLDPIPGVRQRVGDRRLMVPLSADGMPSGITSFQLIDENGEKSFLQGGEVKGSFFPIGEFDFAPDVITIAEGLATGASVHQAVGLPCIIAFNSGNLYPVALKIRSRWPDAAIVMLADNDAKTAREIGKNPGLLAAREAADTVGGAVAIPTGFTDPEIDNKWSDFNDLMLLRGPDAVRQIITPAVDDARRALEVRRLAALPPVEYDRGRKGAIKTLGVRAKTLDNLVEVDRERLNASPLAEYGADIGDDIAQDDEEIDEKEKRPRVLVDQTSPEITVRQIGDVLVKGQEVYLRGAPVEVDRDPSTGEIKFTPLTADSVVMLVHEQARPYVVKQNKDVQKKDLIGTQNVQRSSGIHKDPKSDERRAKDGYYDAPARLSRPLAAMYLSRPKNWSELRPVNGVTRSPLLGVDGSIRIGDGLDAETGLWLADVADVAAKVPATPSRHDALAALQELRSAFRSFPFADAVTATSRTGMVIVDPASAPGLDESTALAAVMTATCRASLWLSPGLMVTAAQLSGAGSGKGKFVRCVSTIGLNYAPVAVTPGHDQSEFEKRISAELISGAPCIFLDNVNGAQLKSDQLASAITERPSRIRNFGSLTAVNITAAAFIAITGNDLRASEDLARRFIEVQFDARTEDPEARSFDFDALAHAKEHRDWLLTAALTIWRWGIQQGSKLPKGRPLGSFEQWGRWCRDPLLALGCRDPIDRLADTKRSDKRRQHVAEIYAAWWDAHGSQAVSVDGLSENVKTVIDPVGRGRQYQAHIVAASVGARVAGYVLIADRGSSKWGVTKYALHQSELEQPGTANKSDLTRPVFAPGGDFRAENFAQTRDNGANSSRSIGAIGGKGQHGQPMTPMHPMPLTDVGNTFPATPKLSAATPELPGVQENDTVALSHSNFAASGADSLTSTIRSDSIFQRSNFNRAAVGPATGADLFNDDPGVEL